MKTKPGLLSLAECVPNLVLGSPLPQARQGISAEFWSVSRFRGVQPTLEAESLCFPSCLLSRSDVNERQPLVTPTNRCCCAYIFNSIPPGIIKLFGHSSDSFAHRFHAKEWSNSLAGQQEAIEAEALVGTIFGQLNVERSHLQKRMAIFREAFCLSLQYIFDWITSQTTASKITQTEDQINQTNEQLQLIFLTVLKIAVLIYHDFRKSRGEDHFDVQSVDELMSNFRTWRNQLL